jgi:hypothetical protein
VQGSEVKFESRHLWNGSSKNRATTDKMKSLCLKSDGEVYSTRLEEYVEGEDGMCSWSKSRIKRLRDRGIQTRQVFAKFHAKSLFVLQFAPLYRVVSHNPLTAKRARLFLIQESQPSDSLTIANPIQSQEAEVPPNNRASKEDGSGEGTLTFCFVQIRHWQI